MSHEVTAALIIESQKILLGLRSATRTFYPDVWDLFGGHVEPGERHEQTLLRELQEELGITPTEWRFLETHTLPIPDPHLAHAFGWASPKYDKTSNHAKPQRPIRGRESQLIVHLYLVTAWKGTPFNRQPEEHAVIHWFSLAEATQLRLADQSYPSLFERYLEQE